MLANTSPRVKNLEDRFSEEKGYYHSKKIASNKHAVLRSQRFENLTTYTQILYIKLIAIEAKLCLKDETSSAYCVTSVK